MQAIETKILPATNNRCARIKASCERGSITMSPPIHDQAWSSEANHVAVANALVAKFVAEDEKKYNTSKLRNPWSARRACGGTKAGYAHVSVTEVAQ